MIRCTIGVLAHNEAHNVLRTLQALLMQQVQTVEIAEIIVIASGCTDQTVALAEGIAQAHPVISVQVETQRTGKAAAIRRLMAMAQGEVIVLIGADTLPEATAVERLATPFANPRVGMTGGRVIPLNPPTTWLGFTVQMLWHVHHRLALRQPKLGEMIAFRNVIENFPEDTATDEPALEALVVAKGFQLAYVPDAIVYNRGPERVDEFLRQRRRVFAGQVRIVLRYSYFTSSLSLRHVFPLVIDVLRSYPRFWLWSLAAMGIECWARLLGLCDGLRGREEVVWRHAITTKRVAVAAEPVTIISVRWPPGSLDPVAFLKDLRRLPEPAGSVFWWDGHEGELRLRVRNAADPLEVVQGHIDLVTREYAQPHYRPAPLAAALGMFPYRPWPAQAAVSCRVVKFDPPSPC